MRPANAILLAVAAAALIAVTLSTALAEAASGSGPITYAMSLYAVNAALEREARSEVISHPLRYLEEMREVECVLEAALRVEPKALCEYLRGEVREPR